jgi:hypothetical protein
MSRPKWEFFTGDLNWIEHSGTWIKRHEGHFEFVELWPYDGDENEKYIMFYANIDLDDIVLTQDIMKHAVSFCDVQPDEIYGNYDYADLAYALFSYARHDDVETGNNSYKMLRSWGIYP